MLTYFVAYCSNAADSLMAVLLNNKLSLSILLVEDGALGLISRILMRWVRFFLFFCSELKVLGIFNGP